MDDRGSRDRPPADPPRATRLACDLRGVPGKWPLGGPTRHAEHLDPPRVRNHLPLDVASSQGHAQRVTTTFEVPLSQLVVRADEPPMIWSHVEALLEGLIVDQRPIQLAPAEHGIYSILNGRHRFVAGLIRGDETLTATLD